MMSHISEIKWNDPVVAVPAFLTLTAIPLSFSIANGIAFGFTSFTLLKILRGEYRQVNWLVYVLTALFIARFLYLGAQ
jgi:AGZA family xanthine/uracil permease-like MFS transporter